MKHLIFALVSCLALSFSDASIVKATELQTFDSQPKSKFDIKAEQKDLLKFLRGNPAVRGSLKNISDHKSRYINCRGLRIETITEYSFSASAYCGGTDGADGEWADIMTIEGNRWEKNSYFVRKIEFQIVD